MDTKFTTAPNGRSVDVKVFDFSIKANNYLQEDGKTSWYTHVWLNDILIAIVTPDINKYNHTKYVVNVYGNWCKPTTIICDYQDEIPDRLTKYMLDNIKSLFTPDAYSKLHSGFHSLEENL